jgi:hypothetical protein
MPPKPVLTRTALEAMLVQLLATSGRPLALGLQPECHPRATVEVWYLGGGTVSLHCHRCKAIFARLALARTPHL